MHDKLHKINMLNKWMINMKPNLTNDEYATYFNKHKGEVQRK